MKGLTVVGMVVFLLIVPWSIRNYRAFETFVPLNTNAGFAFSWGNHPIHGTTFVPLLPADGPSYQDLIPPDLVALNEGAMDRALLKEALGIIRADPARYVLLSISRSREYFKFWPSPESSAISNVARIVRLSFLTLHAVRVVDLDHVGASPKPSASARLHHPALSVHDTVCWYSSGNMDPNSLPLTSGQHSPCLCRACVR